MATSRDAKLHCKVEHRYAWVTTKWIELSDNKGSLIPGFNYFIETIIILWSSYNLKSLRINVKFLKIKVIFYS